MAIKGYDKASKKRSHNHSKKNEKEVGIGRMSNE